MEINEEKRSKFIEFAGKRVNNVMHDIQILEPMSRSASYDFTKQDVDEMFSAMEETLANAKEEFYKKFEEKARLEKKTFSFGATHTVASESTPVVESTTSNCVSATTEATTSTTVATETANTSAGYTVTSTPSDTF